MKAVVIEQSIDLQFTLEGSVITSVSKTGDGNMKQSLRFSRAKLVPIARHLDDSSLSEMVRDAPNVV